MINYKKYIAVSFGVAAFLLAMAWIVATDFRSYFLEPQYGSWQARLDMIDKCDVGSVSIIGDSRAGAAYQPAVLGQNVRNFGFDGVTPIEQYFFIKRMLKCKTPPRLFVLAFSPRQFSNHKWFWPQSVAFGGLNAADLSTIAANETANHWHELYKSSFGSEPPPALKNWLYVEHFPPFYFASMLASIGGHRHAKFEAAKLETVQNNGAFIIPAPPGLRKCIATPSEEAKASTFEVDPESNAYFDKEISEILASGSKVVIGPIPISESTNEQLSESYRASYLQYLNGIMSRHGGVVMLGQPFVVQNDCDFGDGIHVNRDGAVTFSKFIQPMMGPPTTASLH
jgi:hypothetical protein